jgi:ribosome recycling factor
MSDFITEHKSEFQKGISFLQKELSLMQAGRANSSMIEDVSINVYDSTMKLQELATITSPEPRSLFVEPWDKSIIKEIISGLQAANLDMQVIGDASNVRLTVPQITEESRVKIVKNINEKVEKAKVSIRQVRDKVKEEIQDAEKNKEISEDEKFSLLKELDELTKSFVEDAEEKGTKKRDTIMTL